jgi:sugar lactone lactonase YvrE
MTMQAPMLQTPAWNQVGNGHYALGESPFWHPSEQTLYWVDITGRQLLRANVYMGTVDAWDMPSEPGCIAPAAAGGLVVALRDGVYRAPVWGGALHRIAALPYDPTSVRANDGKCDTLGRFWIGTVDETKSQQAAALYSVDSRPEVLLANGGVPVLAQHAGGALTGNGLAWSPDQATLYWADTPRHHVLAWPWDAQTNQIGTQRTYLQFEPKPIGWQPGSSGYAGRPDGATVDSLGNYWVAMYEGRRVCQFAPDGRLLQQIETPVQCPTMPCLGGEDYRTLYITSVRHGRSQAEVAQLPASGGVFAMRVETPGLPVNFFRD